MLTLLGDGWVEDYDKTGSSRAEIELYGAVLVSINVESAEN